MNILEILKDDYRRFPENQSYNIYAKDVYFEDPVNRFTGVERYRKMIGFMGTFFQQIFLSLEILSKLAGL
jgi:hypothetical protein